MFCRNRPRFFVQLWLCFPFSFSKLLLQWFLSLSSISKVWNFHWSVSCLWGDGRDRRHRKAPCRASCAHWSSSTKCWSPAPPSATASLSKGCVASHLIATVKLCCTDQGWMAPLLSVSDCSDCTLCLRLMRVRRPVSVRLLLCRKSFRDLLFSWVT